MLSESKEWRLSLYQTLIMENISGKFQKEKSYEGNASVPVHILYYIHLYGIIPSRTLFDFLYSNVDWC